MPSASRLVLVTQLALALAAAACDGATEPVPPGWSAVRSYATHREVDLGWTATDGAVLSGTLFLPPSPGSYPALVVHMGSDRWTRLDYPAVSGWLVLGMAVFTYDKRGVGRSQGECCPFAAPGYFPLLAGDVLTAARQVAAYPEIRADLVGAWGFSQGGWVVPVAAAQGAGDIAFVWVGSGPAVTLGEELLYSELTGDDACVPSGRSPGQVEAALDSVGPSGFDPKPYLEQLTVPGLWIYGALDTSVPVARSVAVLRDVRSRLGRDITDTVIPGINHSFIVNGAMCQRHGQVWVDGPVTIPWLDSRFPGWRLP